MPVKDVTLPDNPAKKTLLLAKHADYIEAFEKDKDDYVNQIYVYIYTYSVRLHSILRTSSEACT